MKSSHPSIARAALCAAGLAAGLLLAACGGGGDQATSFSAKRVFAFGDEASLIEASGKKYTVNAYATDSTTVLECRSNPIWVQSVALKYGLSFAQCPSSTAADAPASTSRMRAALGAKVADLAPQIDAQIAESGIQAGDLATLFVGVNDVIAWFEQVPTIGEARALAGAGAAGSALAAQANRLAALDARVLIATLPNVGLMPYAGGRSAGSANPNPGVLARLSARFNDAMLSNLLNDGRKIGLIQLDVFLNATDRATALGLGTYANTTLGACAVALPDCTTATLLPAVGTTLWLWADDRHLGAGGQSSLGSLAISRLNTNPF